MKLKGAYRYVYRKIKSEIIKHRVMNNERKQTLINLNKELLNLQANKSLITSDLLNEKEYAFNISKNLKQKKYPYQFKRIASIFSFILILLLIISLYITDSKSIIKLDSPVISTNEPYLVQWNAVENATSYEISLNNDLYVITDQLEYKIIPTAYGHNKVSVCALGNDKKYTSSSWSNVISYEIIKEKPIEYTNIKYNNNIVEETNEIGKIHLNISFEYSGVYVLHLMDGNTNIFGDDYNVSVFQETQVNPYQGENTFYFNGYETYNIEITYHKPNVDLEISFYPFFNVKNKSEINLDPLSDYIYNINPSLDDNNYLVLKDYDPNVFIYSSDYNPTNSFVLPYNSSFSLKNNEDVNKTNQILIKEIVDLENGITHNHTNLNQVSVFRVPANGIMPSYPLYFTINTTYYDVFFMNDSSISKVFVGKAGDNYVVQSTDWLFQSIYVVLVPKESIGRTAETSIVYNKIKPDGVWWPDKE